MKGMLQVFIVTWLNLFDGVSHELLLQKLRFYGVRE